eukprot:7767723-Pyramimonas_sp.AAC.1
MEWTHRAEFVELERRVWRAGGDVAGHARTAGNLTQGARTREADSNEYDAYPNEHYANSDKYDTVGHGVSLL